jgi:hypothetical protein
MNLNNIVINANINEKLMIVTAFEKNCPQTLRDYVVNTLGYKNCNDWPYDLLVDEFGYGYIMHWDEKLHENDGKNITEVTNGI